MSFLSINTEELPSNLFKLKNVLFTIMMLILLLISSLQFINLATHATDGSSADLIIGKKDVGQAIELSVCLKSTGNTIRLTDVSTWFNFQNNQLKPSKTILEAGNILKNNGYSPLKFEQVEPAPTQGQTKETWTMRVDFVGDGKTSGLMGNPISNTNPILLGKVKFDKIDNQSGSITLNKALYYTVEQESTPLELNTKYTNQDCRNTDGVKYNDSDNANPKDPCVPVENTNNCQNASSNTSTVKPNSTAVTGNSLQSVNNPNSNNTNLTYGLRTDDSKTFLGAKLVVSESNISRNGLTTLIFDNLKLKNGQVAANVPVDIRITTPNKKTILLATKTDTNGKLNLQLSPTKTGMSNLFGLIVEASELKVIEGTLKDLNDMAGSYTARAEIKEPSGNIYNSNSVTWNVSNQFMGLTRNAGIQLSVAVILVGVGILVGTIIYIRAKAKQSKTT